MALQASRKLASLMSEVPASTLLTTLTPRELAVAQLIAAGKPSKMIAAEMAMSETYIRQMTIAITRKLDIPLRSAAVLRPMTEAPPTRKESVSRTIETTVMGVGGPGGFDPGWPISFLFIPATLPRDVGVRQVMQWIRIVPLILDFQIDFESELLRNAFHMVFFRQPSVATSDQISELDRLFYQQLNDEDAGADSRLAVATQFESLGRAVLARHPNSESPELAERMENDLQGLKELLHQPLIVIEKSPPQLADFVSILRSGSGAAIGAYAGYAAGQSSPLLLLVTVPFGILVCASAMGIGQALEQGLRTRVHELLVGLSTSGHPKGSRSAPD